MVPELLVLFVGAIVFCVCLFFGLRHSFRRQDRRRERRQYEVGVARRAQAGDPQAQEEYRLVRMEQRQRLMRQRELQMRREVNQMEHMRDMNDGQPPWQ